MLGKQELQVDPQEPVEAGQLQLLQGHAAPGPARLFQIQGDLPQFLATFPQCLKLLQQVTRQRIHDSLQRTLDVL